MNFRKSFIPLGLGASMARPRTGRSSSMDSAEAEKKAAKTARDRKSVLFIMLAT